MEADREEGAHTEEWFTAVAVGWKFWLCLLLGLFLIYLIIAQCRMHSVP